jgi:putative oxidoreductase
MDAGSTKPATGIMVRWTALAPYFKSMLRIVAGLLFMQSGTMKLFGWPVAMPPDQPPLELLSQVGIGGLLEFMGGLLLVIGLFTRPVAFTLSGMMAVAYFQFHQPSAIWPMLNGGTDAVLYSFLWLYFSATGAGPWSIDAMRNKT